MLYNIRVQMYDNFKVQRIFVFKTSKFLENTLFKYLIGNLLLFNKKLQVLILYRKNYPKYKKFNRKMTLESGISG